MTVVAVGALFVAPYLLWSGDALWRYLLPDLGICAVVAWRFRGDAIRRAGLAIPPRHGVLGLVALIAGFLLARAVVGQISASQEIEILGARPIFSLSQVLHQEVVMRGLLLGAVLSWFRSRATLALVAAVASTGVHYLLYWWSDGLLLPAVAVATLFCFGVAINLLFLRAGHIAFSFAAHAAWNLARFGKSYLVRGDYAVEAQSFVEIEGSELALAASAALLAIVVIGGRIGLREDRGRR